MSGSPDSLGAANSQNLAVLGAEGISFFSIALRLPDHEEAVVIDGNKGVDVLWVHAAYHTKRPRHSQVPGPKEGSLFVTEGR